VSLWEQIPEEPTDSGISNVIGSLRSVVVRGIFGVSAILASFAGVQQAGSG
jgi:hypothetical protein